MYYVIYKHRSGGWSAVKTRDDRGLDDAVRSPFTLEVWARPVSPRYHSAWRRLQRCRTIRDCMRAAEELRRAESELMEERRRVEEIEVRMRECKDDDCVRAVLKEAGFTKVK